MDRIGTLSARRQNRAFGLALRGMAIVLRITKLTDYAIVLATQLAIANEPRSCRQLAESTGLPKPTVAKILKTLSRSGLVLSSRGVTGGYSLCRGSDEVSVRDVIEATEGPIAVTECTDDQTEPCQREEKCGLKANWERINNALSGALSAISLADMATSTDLQQELIQLRRRTCS